MEHLKIKPERIVEWEGNRISIDTKQSTIGIGGKLWITRYEEGVRIKAKKQGEIYLPNDYAGDLALHLIEYANPKLYTSVELDWIAERFKYNKDVVKFVERILRKEISTEEIDEIRKSNIRTSKIIKRLKGEKI